jgi:hypothetical protein
LAQGFGVIFVASVGDIDATAIMPANAIFVTDFLSMEPPHSNPAQISHKARAGTIQVCTIQVSNPRGCWRACYKRPP